MTERMIWTNEQVEHLKELAREGFGPIDIARKMRIKVGSATYKFYALGFGRNRDFVKPEIARRNEIKAAHKTNIEQLIGELSVSDYCDWVRAGRPGLIEMSPATMRRWMQEKARA